MPTVTGTLTGVDGFAPPAAIDREVVVTLVDLNGQARQGFTPDDHEIIAESVVIADRLGAWSISLLGNSLVVSDYGTTLYRISEGYDPDLRQPFRNYISVPASGGPYNMVDLRVTPPGGAGPQITGYLPLTGGVMTGAITLHGAPTVSLHAATKTYVDNVSAGASGFLYDRAGVPASTWTISHNLNRQVHVTVLGDDNRKVITDEEHPDLNTVVLTFASPFSGRALLR